MPAVSVQFALILEAYCRGSIPHIEVLKKQVGTHTHLGSLIFFMFVSPDHAHILSSYNYASDCHYFSSYSEARTAVALLPIQTGPDLGIFSLSQRQQHHLPAL